MLAFTALAEPTRLRMMEILAKGGNLPASQIGKHFSISPPAVSQHLKVLRQANLVQVEVKAQQRIYRINPHGISEIDTWLSKMRNAWEPRFDALDELLSAEMAKSKKQKKKVK